jgi:Cytochrome c554 and c-prime
MRGGRSIRPISTGSVPGILVRGILTLGAVGWMGGCGSSVSVSLDPAALRDPQACKTCHPNHFDEWSGSMHAYAGDDPVFLAMNRRAQRETAGALGNFCVTCHAPVAVREGLTTDGLNLAELPQAMKGVTCYFCHATETVAGTHNNPLVLARDSALFGPFGDPVAGMPHVGKYSALFDDTRSESAAACGSCHDIVNQKGAHVERTFQEWQGTLFAQPVKGLSCPACHMEGSDGPASTVSTRSRRLHRHDFPAVDLALSPWPQADEQRVRAQEMLDGTVQSTLCWNPVSSQIEVTLDNVGAGHGWPSGATPDRRAWVEVNAFAGAELLYSSGGAAAGPLESSLDPDLWLMRDCLFDGAQTEVRMFWQAASLTQNQLPGSTTGNINDPASFAGHRQRTFPDGAGHGLVKTPDRITLQVHVQAIGADVLEDLVMSGDLDPAIPTRVAHFELGGAALEWTPGTATPQLDGKNGLLKPCVMSGRYSATVTPADTHAHCLAP